MGGILVAHRERPSAVAVAGGVARRERGWFVVPGIIPLAGGVACPTRAFLDLMNAPRGPAGRLASIRRSAGWQGGPQLEFLFALAAVEVPFLATFERPIETKGWLLERLRPFFPAHRQRHTKQTFNCHELRRNVHAWWRAARVN